MSIIKTYQDLIAVGLDEKVRMQFIESVINDHRSSKKYRDAAVANEYYAKRNVTITQFQKFLYTMSGKKVTDIYSANYKTKTAFFRSMVIQQTQYVLSNGITFAKSDTKDKLGRDFDYQIQTAAKKAMIDGVSFCFFNFDHVEVFGFADTPSCPGFAPLYDEDSSLLRAGVRYWYSGSDGQNVLHATLYEEDGYATYIHKHGSDMEQVDTKRGYIKTATSTADNLISEVAYSNYPSFPIIPLYANDLHESELNGLRESIDCYDYIKNGLANDIDDTAGIYWTIKNSGGFDDEDMVKFLDRLRVVKAASVSADDAEVESHTVDVPVEARSTMLEILRTDLYKDAMLLNVSELSASAKTATEIRAAYQPQDDKCGDFEYHISNTIYKILQLIGIEDEPAYKWNRIANMTEETQMVMLAANYLDDEAILNHLPWITPEEVDGILKRRDAEDLNRLGIAQGTLQNASRQATEPEKVNEDE